MPMHRSIQPSFLLVNADDYGYFPGISRGIIDAHTDGIVTATGVLANGSSFLEDVDRLRATTSLDVGVHLNLTFGRPLTASMRKHHQRSNEKFVSKIDFAKKYILGELPLDDIHKEWCAQIELCRDCGLVLWFLNSHEHIHLLPSLFKLTQGLSKKYKIPHVRLPTARLFETLSPAGMIRAAIVRSFAALHRPKNQTAINFIGFGQSGKLTESYLMHLIRRMQPGKIYELMCHPGYGADVAKEFDHLRAYHNWKLEMQTLTSSAIRGMCEEENVCVIPYRDIGKVTQKQSFV